MKHVVDAELVAEAERFQLRFGCEHCVHFDEPSGKCAEGYPNDEHRAVRLKVGGTLCFCKLFELS
jgi:hypothetical protein